MKKILIFLFAAFILFLLFYKRSTFSFEGNDWTADKLIINGKDLIDYKNRKINLEDSTQIMVNDYAVAPTIIIVNDYIDSLIILNPEYTYKYQLYIEKNKFNKDVAILKSKNILLNDTLEIKLDTIEDKYNRTRKFIVELKSKRTLITMSRSISTNIIPKQPRKPVRGLP